MPIPYDFLALGAAACWAFSSVSSVTPARHLGAFAFTRWRMLSVALLLWTLVAFTGGWRSLAAPAAWPLALSGLLGIFVGDTALFGAMNRLGPRRCGVLFATHAVFSGRGLAFLRSTDAAGDITVKATAPGLEPAVLVINSRP